MPKRINVEGGLLLRSELPTFLGLSRGRIHQLRDRIPDPVTETVYGEPIYRATVIEQWDQKRRGKPLVPGRYS